MVEYNGKQGKGANNNLIPITERTPEERYEICRKGAEAVNAKRAERKSFAEDFITALSTGDTQAAIIKGMCERATKDPQALKLIAELIRENGTTNIKLTSEEDARREAWEDLSASMRETED